MRNRLSLAVLWGAFPLFISLSQAAPVGMAAQVSGAVSVVKDGKKTPLHPLGRLEAGDVVTSGAGAEAVVVLFSGSRFQIGANAHAVIGTATVGGAQKLAAFSGPSAGAVQLLGQARVGAVMARPPVTFQRLVATFPGYLQGTTPRFDWIPIEGAKRYTFTLFDEADNVVLSIASDQTGAAYPAGIAPLIEKTPYLWKLSGFSTSGQIAGGRWGVLTALSPASIAALKTNVAALQAEATANPTDKTPVLLLVETYRSFGVINNALELLDDQKVAGWDDADAARDEIIDGMSPFVRALAERGAAPPALP